MSKQAVKDLIKIWYQFLIKKTKQNKKKHLYTIYEDVDYIKKHEIYYQKCLPETNKNNLK